MRSLPRSALAVVLPLALGLSSLVGDARADDATSLENGINSYEGERYDECIDRFQRMLTPGDPTALKESTMKNRARMYYAACLVAKGRAADADRQMEQLIRDDPRAAPDPAAFPSKVIDRFTEVKARLKDEIERIERERLAKEEAERRKREEEREREKQKLLLLQRLAREEIHVQRNSRWIAAIPFGVGQFQNRQEALGWTFLGSEVATAAVSITAFFAAESIASKYKPGQSDKSSAQSDYNTWRLANEISGGAFVALAVGGILHAELTFVPEFREVEERPLPKDLVVVPTAFGKDGAGVVMSGRF